MRSTAAVSVLRESERNLRAKIRGVGWRERERAQFGQNVRPNVEERDGRNDGIGTAVSYTHL